MDCHAHEKIVAEVRRWIGTPYHHQGRKLGVGVDCVGLLLAAAGAIGVNIEDPRCYPLCPSDPNFLPMTLLNLQFRRWSFKVPTNPGDVGLFWIQKPDFPRHLGFFTGLETFVHVGGRVVEERSFDLSWRKRIVSIFKFPGVS